MRCKICNTPFFSRQEGELCHSCKHMSPDVRDMLLVWKEMGVTLDQKEVQERVLRKTNWWLDVCTLNYMLPALVNSGKLVQDGPGRYRVP